MIFLTFIDITLTVAFKNIADCNLKEKVKQR